MPPGRESSNGGLEPGDVLVLSGPMSDHGADIMALRHAMESAELRSDNAPLEGLSAEVYSAGIVPRTMHDPTRGGVATTVHAVAHTALDPDHYVPFIVLSGANHWSTTRTLAVTAGCGVWHRLSSLLWGAFGLAGRGLSAYGVAYMLWARYAR